MDKLRPHISGSAVWSNTILYFFCSLLKLCCSGLFWLHQPSHLETWGLLCLLAVWWVTLRFSVMSLCAFFFPLLLIYFHWALTVGFCWHPACVPMGLWETDSKYRSEPLNLVYTASKRQSCWRVQPDLWKSIDIHGHPHKYNYLFPLLGFWPACGLNIAIIPIMV